MLRSHPPLSRSSALDCAFPLTRLRLPQLLLLAYRSSYSPMLVRPATQCLLIQLLLLLAQLAARTAQQQLDSLLPAVVGRRQMRSFNACIWAWAASRHSIAVGSVISSSMADHDGHGLSGQEARTTCSLTSVVYAGRVACCCQGIE